MSHTLTDKQYNWIVHLLKIQDEEKFNNGRRAQLEKIKTQRVYCDEEQVILLKLRKDYLNYLEQIKNGNTPGWNDHLYLKYEGYGHKQ